MMPRAYVCRRVGAALARLPRWLTARPALIGRWLVWPVGWLLGEPRRMLLVGWLVGLLVAGSMRSAAAEGFVVGPDLAHGQPRTLFETYDYSDYQLTVKPDDNASGFMDIGKVVYEVVGFINNVMAWICLGLLFGALTLLEWLLNLTVYRDSADQIDVAVQLIASRVFWPLIAATVAVGAFVTYARWRGEGRGFVSDLGWVVAAGTLAVRSEERRVGKECRSRWSPYH